MKARQKGALTGALATALLTTIVCTAHANDKLSPPLRVMLQGDSSSQLSELVRQAGGHVTHKLPIISAVGAELTQHQLDSVTKSPLVARHITDLDIQRDELSPEQNVQQCEVAGAIELDFSDHTVIWRLFNKSIMPTRLTGLTFQPDIAKNAVTGILLNGKPLNAGIHVTSPQSSKPAAQAANKGQLLQPGVNTLTISLARDGDIPLSTSQQHYSASATFEPDCKTRLIKGYAQTQTDSFFPSQVGADMLHRHGVTGKGIGIAVIDSGLWDHKSLVTNTEGQNRIAARYNALADNDTSVLDESGHGTHIASVAADSSPALRAGKPTGAYRGIAPDASLTIIKAFDAAGQADYLDLVRALQYVLDNHKRLNIKVLNLSFAAHPRWPYWLDPINQAVMKIWQAGITVVAAAGNEGPKTMTVGSPGNLPYIITVGAVTDSWTPFDRSDDYIPDFSSRGPSPSAHIKPDVVAPGGHILGLTSPDSTVITEHPEYLLNSGELVLTGTSQASAVISGMAALMLQIDPKLTPNDVKCMLMSSAEPAITASGLLAYSPFTQGSGFANVSRAITLGERGCGNEELDIAKDISGTYHFDGPAIVDERGNVTLPGLAQLLSPTPSEKGKSTSRKWGVKDHIERESLRPSARQQYWEALYARERAAMRALSNGQNTSK